jgi:predicted Zn finger-like uncharacterized protein
MSLITRCPACRTMFKVVPDQLRISEGWVRCGQCDEVFDASAHLQAAVPQQPVSEAMPSLADSAPPMAVTDPASAEASFDTARDEPASAQEPALPTEVPEGGVWVEPVVDDGVVDHLSPGHTVVSMPDEHESVGALLSPGEAEEPSFMREMPVAAAAPTSPYRRLSYAVVAAMLALLMMVQLLMHERDRLAASAPGLKPLLENLCAPMQCIVAPLKQIESIQIDSASFAKVRPEVYRLSLTLRNTASTDLALPAIELSLTDAQDEPLLRRVILAGELGLNGQTLAASSESSVSLTLSVKNAGGAEQFAGYRVLAFYP